MIIYIVETLNIEDSELVQLTKFINVNKQIKINNFLKKTDKIQSLIGEIIIRTELMKNFNLNNKEIKLKENNWGKPQVEGISKFCFNISHSGNYTVVAISENEIGIDIEKIEKFQNFNEIAENFFSKEEFDYIKQGNREESISKFYEIWTLKEAYIKFKGKGLSIELNSFNVLFEENIKRQIKKKEILKSEFFKKVDFSKTYKLAICSSEREEVKVKELNQNDVINNFWRLNKEE